MEIKGTKIVLTGAAGGIGSELAKILSQKGAQLILVDRRSTEGLKTELDRNGSPVYNVLADIATQEGREALLACIQTNLKGIQLLINCAGVNHFCLFEQQSPEKINEIIMSNLMGPILLTNMLLPLLKQQQQALIVNIGSILGSVGFPGFATYSATKFGLRVFSDTLRQELLNTGIKICYIAPRATLTPMTTENEIDLHKTLRHGLDLPDWVAQKIVAAIEKNKNKCFLGLQENFFVKMNDVFPSMANKILEWQLPIILKYLKKVKT